MSARSNTVYPNATRPSLASPSATAQYSTQFLSRRIPLHCTPAEVKKRIHMQWGREKTESYFKLLSQYIAGTVTKEELDQKLKGLLTEPQRKLHNLFLLTILRSTYASFFATNAMQARRDYKPSIYMPRTLDFGATSYAARKETIVKQPGWAVLHSHMNFLASRAGINQVDNNATSLLYFALEARIKSIFASHRENRKSFIVRKKLPPPLPNIIPKDQENSNLLVLEALGYSNYNLLTHSRPGMVDADDVNVAMATEPNCTRITITSSETTSSEEKNLTNTNVTPNPIAKAKALLQRARYVLELSQLSALRHTN